MSATPPAALAASRASVPVPAVSPSFAVPSRSRDRLRLPAFALALALLPMLLPSTALATTVVAYGLYAMGFNVLFGWGGLLSFGHAALLGGGAYATGIALVHFQAPWWLAIAAAPLAGAVVALLMGLLAVRTRGIYFAMVTLALSQCAYYVAYQAIGWTGGENGLRGATLGAVVLPGVTLDPVDPRVRYGVVASCAFLGVAFLLRVRDSAFGAALAAIRENEARARACGFDVRATRLLAFVLSGAVCGLAGGLLTAQLGVVPIETLHYETSGLAVMMTILGGMTGVFGPFAGACALLVLESLVSEWTEHWPLVAGVVFVACVLFLREGLWGTLAARLAPGPAR